MKLYIIAGEASGDLIGAQLVKSLLALNPKIEIWAWGGNLMQKEGAVIRKNYSELAFMGFTEVVKNLPTILNNFDFCKKDILAFNPDIIVFIDYPGFNLRMARWAKQKNFKTYYYVSPQVWAWNTKRVHQIKQNIDRLFCILPFEKDFYKKYNFEVEYVGHPLIDIIEDYKKNYASIQPLLSEKPIIAVLAGSRKQEIVKILPLMLSVAADFPDYEFIVAAVAQQPTELYSTILSQFSSENIKIISNDTYRILSQARVALVKSGTSTLETALFNVPEVVCYKSSNISYQIGKRVIRIPYISLVNLVVGKKIVEELIQNNLNTKNLKIALKEAINNSEKIKEDYIEMRTALGGGGASKRVAEKILS